MEKRRDDLGEGEPEPAQALHVLGAERIAGDHGAHEAPQQPEAAEEQQQRAEVERGAQQHYSGRSAASAPMTVCSHARSSASALRIRRRAQSDTASRVPTA